METENNQRMRSLNIQMRGFQVPYESLNSNIAFNTTKKYITLPYKPLE